MYLQLGLEKDVAKPHEYLERQSGGPSSWDEAASELFNDNMFSAYPVVKGENIKRLFSHMIQNFDKRHVIALDFQTHPDLTPYDRLVEKVRDEGRG